MKSKAFETAQYIFDLRQSVRAEPATIEETDPAEMYRCLWHQACEEAYILRIWHDWAGILRHEKDSKEAELTKQISILQAELERLLEKEKWHVLSV